MDVNTKKVPINYKLKNKIRNICRCEYKYFLNKSNVIGVGCGYKVTGGFKSCNLCIQVFVVKKVSKCKLSFKDIIPKCFKGIKTDVIETGETIASSLTNKVRPVLGGYSISVNIENEQGTAGCLVSNGVLNFVLSTNHVLAGENQIPLRTPIIQPAKEYGGFHPNDTIGTLYKYIPFRFIQGEQEPINLTDCAIGLLQEPKILSAKIALIGNLKGVKKSVKLNDGVKKVGAITELTFGTVNSIHVTSTVTFKSGRRCLFNDLIFTSPMGRFGDSGSILVNKDNYGVGMIFSINRTFSVSCYLNTVLDQLGVHLVT